MIIRSTFTSQLLKQWTKLVRATATRRVSYSMGPLRLAKWRARKETKRIWYMSSDSTKSRKKKIHQKRETSSSSHSLVHERGHTFQEPIRIRFTKNSKRSFKVATPLPFLSNNPLRTHLTETNPNKALSFFLKTREKGLFIRIVNPMSSIVNSYEWCFFSLFVRVQRLTLSRYLSISIYLF